MSDLETRIKPILEPMLHGHDTLLHSDEHLAIARWFLKIAMVHEFLPGREHRFYFPTDRMGIMRGVIPELTAVFLARYVGKHPAQTLFQDRDLSMTTKRGARGNAYVFTMTVGQLALQVFSHRWTKHPNTRYTNADTGRWAAASFEIAPRIIGNCAWPPKFALADDTIQAFADRWHDGRGWTDS